MCEKEIETKVWDPILGGSLWEILWKKINMGATEHEIHIGYISYLYFINCVFIF